MIEVHKYTYRSDKRLTKSFLLGNYDRLNLIFSGQWCHIPEDRVTLESLKEELKLGDVTVFYADESRYIYYEDLTGQSSKDGYNHQYIILELLC